MPFQLYDEMSFFIQNQDVFGLTKALQQMSYQNISFDEDDFKTQMANLLLFATICANEDNRAAMCIALVQHGAPVDFELQDNENEKTFSPVDFLADDTLKTMLMTLDKQRELVRQADQQMDVDDRFEQDSVFPNSFTHFGTPPQQNFQGGLRYRHPHLPRGEKEGGASGSLKPRVLKF